MVQIGPEIARQAFDDDLPLAEPYAFAGARAGENCNEEPAQGQNGFQVACGVNFR